MTGTVSDSTTGSMCFDTYCDILQAGVRIIPVF